ncbi:hypothetical protein C8Q73DRAFT_840381 [Cubamyces lactineus]|nr:hypothetical protein C8Q73DRAFT_840381 [Cubamyces lactineus]
MSHPSRAQMLRSPIARFAAVRKVWYSMTDDQTPEVTWYPGSIVLAELAQATFGIVISGSFYDRTVYTSILASDMIVWSDSERRTIRWAMAQPVEDRRSWTYLRFDDVLIYLDFNRVLVSGDLALVGDQEIEPSPSSNALIETTAALPLEGADDSDAADGQVALRQAVEAADDHTDSSLMTPAPRDRDIGSPTPRPGLLGSPNVGIQRESTPSRREQLDERSYNHAFRSTTPQRTSHIVPTAGRNDSLFAHYTPYPAVQLPGSGPYYSPYGPATQTNKASPAAAGAVNLCRKQNDPNSAPTTLEGRVPLRTGADTLPTGSLVSKRTRACSEDSDGEEAGQPRRAAKTKRTRARSGDFGGEEPGRPQRAAKTKRVRHTRTVPNQDLPDRNPLFIPSPTPLVTVDTCETPDATVQPDPNPFRSVPDDSGDEQGILVQVPESSNGHTAATDLASAERPCELMPVDSADENGGELQNDGELGQESMDSHQFVRLRSLSYVSMVYDVDGDASAMDAEATSPTSLNLHDQPLSVVNGNNLPMVPGNELPQHDWPHNQVLIQEEETPVRVLRDEAVPQLMRRIEDDLEPPTSPNGSGFPSSSEKTAALLCDNDAPADDLGATLVDAASDSVHPPLAGTDSTREHSNPLRLDAELSHIRSRLDWLSQGDSASEVPPIPPIPDPQHNLTPSEVGVIDAACQNGSLLPAASDTGRGRPSVVIHVHAQGGSRVVLELL